MQYSFVKQVLIPVSNSIENYPERNAFYIRRKFYTYRELGCYISRIQETLKAIDSDYIGLVANDDIETYASILALWFEGKNYIPLHPGQPLERCNDIIDQVGMKYILDSSACSRYPQEQIIATFSLNGDSYYREDTTDCSDNRTAYILFTSGSTGKPKGVPVTRGNIAAFIAAFWNIGYELTPEDRCLQCFDLTFDLSVISYLVPLLKGACVYTVPHDQIKYNYTYGLLEEHELTFALMVPSTIRYLRPYFNEIRLPFMRYSLFCGEALPLDMVQEWSECLPNAFIDNVYGPTEDTIFCSWYRYNRHGVNKSHNGILSIGKSMNSGKMIIADELNCETKVGEQGELCLSGAQLTPGYWNNPAKNAEAFFLTKNDIRFYRTGDCCFQDKDGDIMYVGRLDFQAKIQGFRVELGEIEFHAREFLENKNTAAIVFENTSGHSEIALFVESTEVTTTELTSYLQTKMPSYMVPAKIYFVNPFPLNINGKTDRNQLKTMMIN